MADNPADNSNNASQPPRRRGRPPGSKNSRPSAVRPEPGQGRKASNASKDKPASQPVSQPTSTAVREEHLIPPPPTVEILPPPPPMAGPAPARFPPKPAGDFPPKQTGDFPPRQTGTLHPDGERGNSRQQPGGSRPTGPRRPQNPLDRGPRRNQADRPPAPEKQPSGQAEEPARGDESAPPANPSQNNGRSNPRFPPKQTGGIQPKRGRPYSNANRQNQSGNQNGKQSGNQSGPQSGPQNGPQSGSQSGNQAGNGQNDNRRAGSNNPQGGENNRDGQTGSQNRPAQRRHGGQNRSNPSANRNEQPNRGDLNGRTNQGSRSGSATRNKAQNQGPRQGQNANHAPQQPQRAAQNNRANPGGQGGPSGSVDGRGQPGQRKPAKTRRGPTAGGQNGPGSEALSGENSQAKPGSRGVRKPRNNNPFVYHKPPPIKTSSGIKALSQNGNYALSWWAARWIAAMENLVDGRRLSRGKSYAKEGQVLSIEEKPGGVQAMVQGSRPKPYRVAIEVIPLSDREWEQVFDVLASQALFAAQLLAGEMPRNIEEAFDAAGTSLFPARLGDLHTDCSCPDWANPCKHVAATHYILAERFDEDPFLLFRLRGRTSEQILTALRERRSSSNGEEPLPEEPPQEEIQPAPPLSANLAGFYSLAQPLDEFALSFKAPAIEMAVLKRLGDPNFLGQESLLATLEPVYRAVRASALEAALGEAKEEETSE